MFDSRIVKKAPVQPVSSAHLHSKVGEEIEYTQLKSGDEISFSLVNALCERPEEGCYVSVAVKRPEVELLFEGNDENGNVFKVPSVVVQVKSTADVPQDYFTIMGIIHEIFPTYSVSVTLKGYTAVVERVEHSK